jgi:hypothetical protein
LQNHQFIERRRIFIEFLDQNVDLKDKDTKEENTTAAIASEKTIGITNDDRDCDKIEKLTTQSTHAITCDTTSTNSNGSILGETAETTQSTVKHILTVNQINTSSKNDELLNDTIDLVNTNQVNLNVLTYSIDHSTSNRTKCTQCGKQITKVDNLYLL